MNEYSTGLLNKLVKWRNKNVLDNTTHTVLPTVISRLQRGCEWSPSYPYCSPQAPAWIIGKNIQEVSYQEGSKDLITHTESSGFHFIEIHQGTVGAMLIFLMILGVLLCCLRLATNHHLRRRRFRDVMRKKVEERVQRFSEGYTQDWEHRDRIDQQGGEDDIPYVWDCDYSRVIRPQLHLPPTLGYGNNQMQTLIAGRYPTASLSNPNQSLNRNQHHRCQLPLLTSAEVASRIGSYREPSTPPNSPTRPGHRVRQRVQSWEMQPLGRSRRVPDMYVPEREPDEIESPRSHHHPEYRSSTPQSPARVLPPTPATRLKGGFAGVEHEI